MDGDELSEEEEDALSGRRCMGEPVKNERDETLIFPYFPLVIYTMFLY